VKILLINDNSGHPNWGAQATPYSLIRILERSMPDVEVVPLTWYWLLNSYRRFRFPPLRKRTIRPERSGILRPILWRLTKPVDFYPHVADDFDAFADAWMEGRGGPDSHKFIRLAKDSDLVLYNGENSIYRNTAEGCHGLFLLWLAKTRLGKPSCLVNHTANLNEVRAIMNAMVQRVDPILDLVAVRESRSLKCLHEMGIDSAVMYPDVVFAEDPSEISSEPFRAWSREVGLGSSPYFCLSGSGLPMSQPNRNWHGAVGDLVEDLKTLGIRPVLLARDRHCQFLGEVAQRTDSLYFGPEHSFFELWPLFQGAQFSVTGHFHYMIMGSSVGCPFIPLSNNNHKVSGVCELLQWHRTEPFDATWLASCREEIVVEARRIMDDRDSLRQELLDRTDVLRAQARDLGDRIREIAEQGTQPA